MLKSYLHLKHVDLTYTNEFWPLKEQKAKFFKRLHGIKRF